MIGTQSRIPKPTIRGEILLVTLAAREELQRKAKEVKPPVKHDGKAVKPAKNEEAPTQSGPSDSGVPEEHQRIAPPDFDNQPQNEQKAALPSASEASGLGNTIPGEAPETPLPGSAAMDGLPPEDLRLDLSLGMSPPEGAPEKPLPDKSVTDGESDELLPDTSPDGTAAEPLSVEGPPDKAAETPLAGENAQEETPKPTSHLVQGQLTDDGEESIVTKQNYDYLFDSIPLGEKCATHMSTCYTAIERMSVYEGSISTCRRTKLARIRELTGGCTVRLPMVLLRRVLRLHGVDARELNHAVQHCLIVTDDQHSRAKAWLGKLALWLRRILKHDEEGRAWLARAVHQLQQQKKKNEKAKT